MIICVTGKIGTGKSTVSRFFENRGFVHINVDKLGHRAFEEMKEDILNAFGTTDRKKVGEIVFRDKSKLSLLESILHPKMKELLMEEIKKYNGRNIVIEAAIKRRLKINCCDIVITVVSTPNKIKERLRERYSDDLINEILKNQEDIIEEGIIIENIGTIEELETKLNKVWEEYIKDKVGI
ncbi:dephospho-CoA kinase [Fervidobacterium nodosum]|uniref:Dephospho-CoA kinase n=1 Tax=Fervidobacterium nodosum (strain ATCC 35602 / DSM 5306 / Rt17-B1) TaxID=381764 RepID=A7HLE5_FERNB|nr:dephospho-CoA kinase [Fervidobacterium nodosum]ABS60728.1 dephospho-CoA kinase [Fervidobacterium nodosum Rt17-B1]PHJ14188.1 dephospho-CoA kinase [Fervidobacterium sp. SC_NGM5_G05]